LGFFERLLKDGFAFGPQGTELSLRYGLKLSGASYSGNAPVRSRGSPAPRRSGYNSGDARAVLPRDQFAINQAAINQGCDEEGICATRIILNKTGKSTKLAVW
jgi:hypothetical protein